ncbi:MAG: TolC family protein [Sphingobacteriales bacterium]|nr:MAG: TolC family protein [Sphingobacteriales bacterium]
MRLKYNHTWVLLTQLLSACHISKDVTTPISSIPSTYRNATGGDTQTIASVTWKQFFPDAQLQDLIDTALANNYDMQLAVKNIEIAAQSLKQAKMSLVPAVTMNVGASSTIPSKNSLNGSLTNQFLGTQHIEDFNANIGLSWEADFWGKVRNRKRGALSEYLQSNEARKAIQTSIVSLVAQGYYNLLMLDEQLDIARKNAALTDSTVRILQLQETAGQVTALATQQAIAQKLTAAQLVPELERAMQVQENTLSVLTGRLPHDIARSKQQEKLQSISFDTGVPAQLLQNRPDVRQAELALTVANSRVGLAKADFYPSLVITATGGVNSFKATNWFNIPASLFGVVAGSLAQPLLQRRSIRTRYEIALLEREKTAITFRQSILQSVSEVSSALVRLEKLDEEYDIATEKVEVSKKATRNAQLLFQNGMANYLEVINAQSNLLQSELVLANLKTAKLSAAADLYRSVGGGWN